MLVAGRREGESIFIETTDGEIVVSLERLHGTQTRIGKQAPEQVKVLREEVVGRSVAELRLSKIATAKML
ncbi:MAG: carbon storage regulator [Gammaproteobacteria bacterium]|nr:carbon storage regulator [Gammaproteobacteria bacterium]